MSPTIAEKILGGEADEIVTKEVDRVMLHDGNTPLIFDEMEGEEIRDPSKVTAVTDHFCPPSTVERAGYVKGFREFVKDKGIDDYIEFEGICHQVMVEGRVKPGEFVVGIDSHSTTYGGAGAFGVGLGALDTAEVLKTGGTWFKVPRTIRVNIHQGKDGTDISLRLLKELNYSANYRALEFYDKTGLSMDARLTVSNMAAETGAKAAVFPPDDITQEYTGEDISAEERISLSDEEACESVVDVEAEVPLIAVPHKPYNVKKAEMMEGKTMDQVFIGSCASGRISDLRKAADVLEGESVHDDVRLLITPASERIYQKALSEGLIDTLTKAGAVILNPSCGPCAGIDKGLMAEGETCLTTQNRNYRGRMGKGSIYIANAEICALSSLDGVVTVPEGEYEK